MLRVPSMHAALWRTVPDLVAAEGTLAEAEGAFAGGGAWCFAKIIILARWPGR